MPFLLPMMLQLGFGLSALHSGLITFTSSIGSLAMRLVAPGILRRLGFRVVLSWIGLIATLLLATTAAFRPGWPLAAIYGYCWRTVSSSRCSSWRTTPSPMPTCRARK